jgi:hypothetical protein
MKIRITLLAFAVSIVGCGGGSFPDHAQVGYFKDSQRNRAFTFNCSECNESLMREHANQQPHTVGQITYVAFYGGSAPDITGSSNYYKATDIASSSGPLLEFMKNPSGKLYIP